MKLTWKTTEAIVSDAEMKEVFLSAVTGISAVTTLVTAANGINVTSFSLCNEWEIMVRGRTILLKIKQRIKISANCIMNKVLTYKCGLCTSLEIVSKINYKWEGVNLMELFIKLIFSLNRFSFGYFHYYYKIKHSPLNKGNDLKLVIIK